MYNKVILENYGMLRFIHDYYKKKKSDKSVDYYFHALQFVPDCCKTQKICDKTVETYPSAIQFVP